MSRLQLIKVPLFIIFSCIAQFTHSNSIENPVGTDNPGIQHVLNSQNHPYTSQHHFLINKKALDELYLLSPEPLLWIKKDSQDNLRLQSVLQMFAKADASGLNQADYNLDWLKTKLDQLGSLESFNSLELAFLDTAISINLLNFLSDLHYGRIDPRTVGFNFKIERNPSEFVKLILTSLKQDNLNSLVEKLEPNISVYQQLKKGLSDFRKISALEKPSTLKYRSSIRPGNNSSQIILIKQQLKHLGLIKDQLAPDTDNNLYTPELVNLIKEFQYRHGLTQDGVIGKLTIKALNMPLSDRIQQIELAMERLRWLPKTQADPLIFVNIPAFQLWAFDSSSAEQAQMLNMKVIVGKSKKLKSPVFSANMFYLEFSPYWNIPKSITIEEILPKLQDNNLYLEQQGMELVTGFHNNEQAIPYSEDAIEYLANGSLRLRQRPGRGNALGKVKFIFPNNYNVYLHDTSSRHLFQKDKRDLSHGCIRVEKPTELAKFLLKSKPWWNKKRIQRTMHAKRPQRVNLKTPVPVIIFYSTAFAIENTIFFYHDVYQYDKKLKRALNRHSQKQLSILSQKKLPITKI